MFPFFYDRFMEKSRQFWRQYVEQRKKWEKLLYEDIKKAREIKFPKEPKVKYSLSRHLRFLFGLKYEKGERARRQESKRANNIFYVLRFTHHVSRCEVQK